MICKCEYIHIWGIYISSNWKKRHWGDSEVRKDGTCQRRRICSAHAQDHESARCGVSIFYEIHLNEKEESEVTKCNKTS